MSEEVRGEKQGRTPPAEWGPGRRYLASNEFLARDKEVSSFAGGAVDCPAGDEIKKGYVCPGWFDKLRPDLELVAQL